MQEREEWVRRLLRVAGPVLACGEKRELKTGMPVQGKRPDRCDYARLEAVSRLLCGMAPWLEAEPAGPWEAAEQAKCAAQARATIESLTDPASPDYALIYEDTPFSQSLVDMAFLAEGVLRAPTALYEKLSPEGKSHLTAALLASRRNRPAHNNWLLFSATVEACLHHLTGECDLMRVDYALAQHEQWYKGDGAYGDGPGFHHDYYNSFVIQPMMADILQELGGCFTECGGAGAKQYAAVLARLARYAAVLEKSVAPDGSFPAVGRSIAYRCGVFHALAAASLRQLPLENVSPAMQRSALTAVLRRCLDAPANYDEKGWLRIGLCGDQPGAGEEYIGTGSLYLCSTAFLPLGLSVDAPFWRDADEPFSGQKVWGGQDFAADHSAPV